MDKIRILVAENDFIYRFFLNNFFQNSADITIVAETKGIEETLEKTLKLNPDVVLSDISLITNETNIIPIIRRIYPSTIIGLLLPTNLKIYEEQSTEFGADFALAKDSVVDSLMNKINKQMRNRKKEFSSADKDV